MKNSTAKNKIKIFDDNKLLKALKIIVLCCSGILLLWFTFDMTGLKIGNVKLVTSCFSDEPIDFVFYLFFIGCIAFFIFKDNIGKYVLTGFILLWGSVQLSVYFKSGESLNAYNNFFADTHHLIAASQKTVIKDTYHVFLDIFILLVLISVLTFTITKIITKPKHEPKEHDYGQSTDF